MNNMRALSMRRAKRAISAVFRIVLLLLLPMQASNQEFTEQLKSLTDSWIRLIQSEKYHEAAELFHYPVDYSESDLAQDKKAVALELMELSKLFGDFERFAVVQRPVNFYYFGVGGGSIRYWEKYPESIQVKYETTFSKEGEGFISFQIVQIRDKLEIRSAAFGIPVDSPRAKDRMERIYRQMKELINQKAKLPPQGI